MICAFFVARSKFGRAKIIHQRPTPWSAVQWFAEIGWALQCIELLKELALFCPSIFIEKQRKYGLKSTLSL
jgi:hypothetical protein